jgi:Domain of unknown function (DUF397)
MTATHWRKSTTSSAGNCDCVELKLSAIEVHIRDSKHVAPILRFTTVNWRVFLDEINGSRGA